MAQFRKKSYQKYSTIIEFTFIQMDIIFVDSSEIFKTDSIRYVLIAFPKKNQFYYSNSIQYAINRGRNYVKLE